MALQIITTIGAERRELDLYGDQPLLLNFSFAEIQNITTKNSAFSQSFQIPGTKNNNEIFNYYYDISSIPFSFNPNQKFPAILTWDGQEVLQGNMRMESAAVINDETIYNVTFYNQVGDLAANIGDKFLVDTDLTHLDHPYSENVILQSQQDPNLIRLTGTTNYSYQNGKTMWGLYNIGYNYLSGSSVNFIQTPLVYFTPPSGGTYNPQLGYFDFSGSPVWDYYFKPSIQVKELYESICRDAGYEVRSDFFNTAYFQRYYLPLKFLDETPYTKGAVEACFTLSAQTIPAASYLNYVQISGRTTCNSLNWGTGATNYTIQPTYPGTYTIRYNFDAIPTIDCLPPISVATFFLVINDGTTATTILADQVCAPSGNSLSYQVDYVLQTTGGTYETYFIYQDCYVTGFTQTLVPPVPRYLVSGQTINYQVEFPPNDYKQIDFITSVNRYFNLVMVPDPDYPNGIIVEPIVDYIGKGQVLDWTTKVDRSQAINITPTTALVNGTLDFDFKLDQDWANNTFKQAANRVFGTERKQLNIDYKDSVIKFDTVFSSPLDITIYSAQQSFLTLPSFSKLNQKDAGGEVEQQFVPFKILPRLLFRGPVLSNETYGGISGATGGFQKWYVKAAGTGYTMNHFQEINRFTTYPWNYNGFSHYTNYRGEDRTTITPLEDTFSCAEDLYDIYYNDYIQDLISPENKIVSCKIYLTPWEVKQLRYNEKILIDNTYYRINRISNYNLLEPALCDIELIKLTREYEGHRVINYRLDPCTAPGDTLWTNSDLMYNLYAYIEKYVKIYDENLNYIDCYQVFEDTTGLGIGQQEKYWISTGFTNASVGVYNDCGCTGTTNMIVVQETSCATPTPSPSPQYSPTPTPSITPTITPSSVTPTPTPTVTSTPPSGQLFVNAKYIGSDAILQYDINGGTTQTLGNIDSLSCQYFFTINGLSVGDTINFYTSFTCAIALSTTNCPNSFSGCFVSHNYVGTQTIYISVDGSNCC